MSRPNLQNDICYGTLLSREQYLHDVEHWKYRDGREQPCGPMTREQLECGPRQSKKRPSTENRRSGDRVIGE